MAYDNSNSGVLFINNKRNGNDKAPTMKGNGRITIDGVEHELDIAAWTRTTEKAGKFLSLSIKLKTDGGRGEVRGAPRQQGEDISF